MQSAQSLSEEATSITNVSTSGVLCVKVRERLRDTGVDFESGGVTPASIEEQIKLFNPDVKSDKAKQLLHDSKAHPRPKQAH